MLFFKNIGSSFYGVGFLNVGIYGAIPNWKYSFEMLPQLTPKILRMHWFHSDGVNAVSSSLRTRMHDWAKARKEAAWMGWVD